MMVRTRGNTQDDKDQLRAVGGALWGMGRTMARELPDWQITCVDIDDTDRNAMTTQLIHEIPTRHSMSATTTREAQVAYCVRGVRHVARLATVASDGWNQTRCCAVKSSAIHPDACYLITGGMGAVGLQIAHQLAADGARQLVLVSRNRVLRPMNSEKPLPNWKPKIYRFTWCKPTLLNLKRWNFCSRVVLRSRHCVALSTPPGSSMMACWRNNRRSSV